MMDAGCCLTLLLCAHCSQHLYSNPARCSRKHAADSACRPGVPFLFSRHRREQRRVVLDEARMEECRLLGAS